MGIRQATVEIDENLLRDVQQVLSTTTLQDTIEEAFREILRARARREEVEALSSMSGMDLDAMGGAWRP